VKRNNFRGNIITPSSAQPPSILQSALSVGRIQHESSDLSASIKDNPHTCNRFAQHTQVFANFLSISITTCENCKIQVLPFNIFRNRDVQHGYSVIWLNMSGDGAVFVSECKVTLHYLEVMLHRFQDRITAVIWTAG